MKSISRAVLPLLAATAVAAPTFAQKLSQERGNIVSTDWRAMQVEIKDPKGRVGTWKVRRDAQVVFTDKKDQFPNPKLADLRAPMYVHFTFEGGTTPGSFPGSRWSRSASSLRGAVRASSRQASSPTWTRTSATSR